MNLGGNTANLRPPWPKGVSGNPNGRPKKVQTVAELAEDNGEKSLQTLIKLLDSSKERVALAAAQAILDRAVGKPRQSVDMGVEQRQACDYSEFELIALVGPDDALGDDA